MEVSMDPKYKQMLDDVFDAFTMLAEGAIVEIMHVQGNTTRWSPAGVELFGLSGEYIPNGSMDWGDYVHPEDRKRYLDVMTPLITGGTQTYDLTYRVRTKDGEYGNFRAVGAVLRDANGDASLIGGVLINQGLTENVDPVTVLPNRNAYYTDLTEWMNEGKATFTLLVGFNGLAEINRVHGYTYGNRLLQEAAWMLQEIVKDRGTLYRMEDATFAILTDQLSHEEISATYDMIRYRMQRGIQINGIRNILSSNGGLVSTRAADINAVTIYSCLTYAYEESRRHRHGDLVDFNGSVNYDQSSRSLEMINAVHDHILDGCKGFFMEYEPVMAFPSGEMRGAESQICWRDEVYGRVGPEDFMPVMEHDFVFEELGDFILRQSLQDGVKFLEKDPGFLLCVNVYRIQLDEEYFPGTVARFLKETGFPASQLSLKLTRDCQLLDPQRLKELIGELHRQKILVVADSFGTGFDSLGFLKTIPVDAVCLDSSLLDGVEEHKRDRNILKHLTAMAASCVEHVNVKGVDNERLRDILKDSSAITTAQGAYYSPPLGFEQFVRQYYSK